MTDYLEIARHQISGGQPIHEQWLGLGEFVGKRWVRTAWADRYNLINELGAMNGGAGQLWPYNTNLQAYLYSAECTGSGRATFDANGLAQYEAALIRLNYSTRAPVLFGTWLITETIEPAKQYMSFDAEGLKLRWEGEEGDEANGELIKGWLTHLDCRLVYVLEFYNVTAGPTASMSYVGGCNASSVSTLTLGISFGAQSLLHSDPYIKRAIRPGYYPRYFIRYRWPYHPYGWNKKWNPKTGLWANVYSSEGQVIFHPPVNFSHLYPV